MPPCRSTTSSASVTGFDGTPIVRTLPSGEVVDRTIAVRFDANVAPGLNWRFAPETPDVKVKVGETTTVLYRRHERRRAADDGRRDLQRPAGARRRLFREDPMLLLHRTDPCSPARAVDSAVVFYVDPGIVEGPES